MITITKGNLIYAEAEALVNTVNCVGHMGKGIALQFKKAFPDNFKAYEQACRKEAVRPGQVLVYETSSILNPKYIINFPTKRHWRGKSQLKDIEAGLISLVKEIKKRHISSIAIPPLGCGLGGLKWNVVRPLIESAFSDLPEVEVALYEPAGTPDTANMPIRTKYPGMTSSRAMFIKLMQQYSELAYRLTLLEMHKLAYFLQEAGEQLRLRYIAHLYGPYAHNLNKVLEVMEGHFIKGYGDSQKPDIEIELLPGTIEKANKFLKKHHEAARRLKVVAKVIEGFETPYGMELLASVHWVVHHNDVTITSVDDVVQEIHSWNDRKRKVFKPEHIHVAWQRLSDEGWLPNKKKDLKIN